MDLQVQFRGAIVGFSRNITNDMWYMEGKWEPAESASSGDFQKFLNTARLKKNMAKGTGKLVKWRELGVTNWQDGLAMGLVGGSITIRTLQPETVSQLEAKKEYR